MNKKKAIKLGVSLSLVGALGVGATFAMFSDNTDPLTNTFALSEKGIGITLDEQVWNGEGRTDEGNNYTELVSGQTVDKDPTVSIMPDSLNANVFVKVVNSNGDNLSYNKDNIGDECWKDITESVENNKDNALYFVYNGSKAMNSNEEGDIYKIIPNNPEITLLEPVFTQVTVKDFDAESKPTKLENIIVKAAAVQADSVSDKDALSKAIELLND